MLWYIFPEDFFKSIDSAWKHPRLFLFVLLRIGCFKWKKMVAFEAFHSLLTSRLFRKLFLLFFFVIGCSRLPTHKRAHFHLDYLQLMQPKNRIQISIEEKKCLMITDKSHLTASYIRAVQSQKGVEKPRVWSISLTRKPEVHQSRLVNIPKLWMYFNYHNFMLFAVQMHPR